MMISRETIYAALFARVAGAAPFGRATRRASVGGVRTLADFPALFMQQTGEQRPAGGSSTAWTLSVDLSIGVCVKDPYVAPATVLNPLIDAVEAALAPQATGMQDLGLPMMVQHAYIAGVIQIEEGMWDDQAVAIIPIDILCLA